MAKVNEIIISSCINRLYRLHLDELLYDSDVDNHAQDKCSTCSTSCDSSCDDMCEQIDLCDLSSEDYYYANLFRKKNSVEEKCFGKKSLVFINVDSSNNTYGCFFPDCVESDENYCMNISMFTITKGIEIIESKYEFDDVITCVSFPKDCLYCVGEGSQWVYKVVQDGGTLKIVWNDSQKVLRNYNRTIMKTAPLKRLVVYSTTDRTVSSGYFYAGECTRCCGKQDQSCKPKCNANIYM